MERCSVLLRNIVVEAEEAHRQWEAGRITNSFLPSALERITLAVGERKLRSEKEGRRKGAQQSK